MKKIEYRINAIIKKIRLSKKKKFKKKIYKKKMYNKIAKQLAKENRKDIEEGA
jgi:hypothetical protein